METSVSPSFWFCSPHFSSFVLSTWAESCRAVRHALPWPRALTTGVLSGRKNRHVTQQQGSPLLRPDGPESAYSSPEQLLLCHGAEGHWSDTHTVGRRRTMMMSLVACRLVSWSPPCYQKMKRTEETCTSGSNLEGSSSAARSPISLLLLVQHAAIPLSLAAGRHDCAQPEHKVWDEKWLEGRDKHQYYQYPPVVFRTCWAQA